VASYFHISVADLKSKTRKKEIATARQIAMHFSKEYTNIPLKSIGDSFGGRDHSTVVHASKAVLKKSSSDALYSKILSELQDQIQVR
jgi:chromosomal replication initiation ATPase DnaA